MLAEFFKIHLGLIVMNFILYKLGSTGILLSSGLEQDNDTNLFDNL